MKAKIKAFLEKHWKITLAAVLLVTIVGSVVTMMTSPFKKTADDLGIIEMHENVKYAVVARSSKYQLLPITNQKRLDKILNILHDAEFREILWTYKRPTSVIQYIDFYTVDNGKEVTQDDVHQFRLYGDIFKRSVIEYTHGGRTRYFVCTNHQKFGEEIWEAKQIYGRH